LSRSLRFPPGIRQVNSSLRPRPWAFEEGLDEQRL
jgi:hypothetical protein